MTKIPILFDANPALSKHKTGIGYFTQGLLEELSKDEGIELQAFIFDFLGRNRYENKLKVKSYTISLIPGRLISIFTRFFGITPYLDFLLVRKIKGWVLYTNYSSFPSIGKARIATFIHDLSFIDLPQTLESKNLQFLKRAVPQSIQRSDIIFCISEFTKSRLLEHFPTINPGSVAVTPIPVIEKGGIKSREPKRLNLKKGRYILSVSTIEPRKNYDNLIKAFLLLPIEIQNEYPLVIVGGTGWKSEQTLALINSLIKDGVNIKLAGYVSDNEIEWLYNNASIYTLATQYEGFGMPVLEAMYHGLPCAVSDIPVLREVGTDLLNYFDQNNPQKIAEVIISTINSPYDKHKLIKASLRYRWLDVRKIIVKQMTNFDKP